MQDARFFVERWRAQVHRAPHPERCRLPDRGARLVNTGVEAPLDQLDQARRHHVIVVHGVRIVAHRGGIAHHHKHVAHPQRVGGQQVALHAQQVTAAGRKVQHGF